MKDCQDPLQWFGLYQKDGKYKNYLSKETNSHPAKMSMALADKIIRHLEALDLLKPGDRIIDFMAGTARTGVVAELHGYAFTGIELESHFIDLINGYDCDGEEPGEEKTRKDADGNEETYRFYGKCRKFEYRHEPHFVPGNRQAVKKGLKRDPNWNIIQGDSRNLSGLLEEHGAGATSTTYVNGTDKEGLGGMISPPYSNIEIGKGLNTKPPRPGHNDQSGRSSRAPSQSMTRYTGLTSPAYSTASDRFKYEIQEGSISQVAPRQYDKSNHGDSEGQIGNLPDKEGLGGMISPLYGDAKTHPSIGSANREDWGKGGDIVARRGLTSHYETAGIVSPTYGKAHASDGNAGGVMAKNRRDLEKYVWSKGTHGKSEGQIGNLPDNQLVGVTSSPYEASVSKKHGGKDPHPEKAGGSHIISEGYSENEDNIGNDQGETYLSAMEKVYRESFKAGISPLVTVTKNPTKNHELRRLDLDTMALLEKVGYMIVDYHQAVLFKEATQKTLFDEEVKQVSGQLSFFKRLHYAKGSPTARWEDIIIAIIPEGPS